VSNLLGLIVKLSSDLADWVKKNGDSDPLYDFKIYAKEFWYLVRLLFFICRELSFEVFNEVAAKDELIKLVGIEFKL
jgi:hypothetical protein